MKERKLSNTQKHTIVCKIEVDNDEIQGNINLSKEITEHLSSYYKRHIYKSVSHKVGINQYRVRSWFQRGSVINAYDLILLMKHYEFVKEIVERMLEN